MASLDTAVVDSATHKHQPTPSGWTVGERDYELTDLGRGLSTPVQALGKWAIEHQPEIQRARTEFDARNE